MISLGSTKNNGSIVTSHIGENRVDEEGTDEEHGDFDKQIYAVLMTPED